MADANWLRQQNVFGNFGQTPNFGQFDVPGLMDSPPGRNPFGDLFQPPPLNIAPPQVDAPLGPSPVSAPPDMSSPPASPEDPNDPMGIQKILDLINKGYHPDTAATDRLNQFLSQFPQEEKPGFAKSLLAGLSAFKGGPESSDKLLYGQHNRDLANWKAQADPIYNAANLERQANVNERTLVGNVITAQAAAQRLQESERKSKAEIASKEKIAEQKAETERRKIQLMAEKQNGTTFTFTKSGQIIAHKLDGTIYDTGENIKDYTPIEVANIQARSRENVAETQAASREAVAATGAESREKIANEKGWAPPVMIADPKDPTKQIAVQTHLGTGEVREVKLAGQNVGVVTKPGTTPKTVQPNNIQDIQNSARETLKVLDELLDEKGKLKSETTAAVGKSRLLGLQHIYGSDTRAADAKITRLKNRITVGLIGEMKAQSKTGATGFGQLNMRELDVLERAASNLDPTLDEETFAAELARIREKLNKVLLPMDGLNPTTTKKPTAAELRKKYGG